MTQNNGSIVSEVASQSNCVVHLKMADKDRNLNWFMHLVARVSIIKYRNPRTQQMFVHSLVCIFYKPPEDGHQQGPKYVLKKCTLNCAQTFVAYGGFYTY
jgi:hypothetical protein